MSVASNGTADGPPVRQRRVHRPTNRPKRQSAHAAKFAVPASECRCGKCSMIFSGEPAWGGFCHCQTCRRAHGTVASCLVVYHMDKITATGIINEHQIRGKRFKVYFCDACGDIVYCSDSEGMAHISVTQFVTDGKLPKTLMPKIHINYSERVHDGYHRDGLPKFLDRPKSLGGSDKIFKVPEVRSLRKTAVDQKAIEERKEAQERADRARERYELQKAEEARAEEDKQTSIEVAIFRRELVEQEEKTTPCCFG